MPLTMKRTSSPFLSSLRFEAMGMCSSEPLRT